MIYCFAPSTLLYIGACESLAKEPVTYVHYKDVTPEYNCDNETRVVKKWVELICDGALINLTEFCELRWKRVPTGRNSKEKLPGWTFSGNSLIELPNWAIVKDDTVTESALDLWSGIIKRKPLNIIGHSAGALNMIPALCGYSSSLVAHLRTIRNLYFRQHVTKVFLYNGVGQQIGKFLPWYLANKVQLIDCMDVNRLCQELAEKLGNQYSIISEISEMKNVTLYASTLEVEDGDYQVYLEKQIQEYPFSNDTVFVIKNHPRDARDYNHYFDQLGLKTISLTSLEWRWFPLEIIINVNPEFRYLGCYSSSMGSVDASRRYISMPANDEVVKLYQRAYSALAKSLI